MSYEIEELLNLANRELALVAWNNSSNVVKQIAPLKTTTATSKDSFIVVELRVDAISGSEGFDGFFLKSGLEFLCNRKIIG